MTARFDQLAMTVREAARLDQMDAIQLKLLTDHDAIQKELTRTRAELARTRVELGAMQAAAIAEEISPLPRAEVVSDPQEAAAREMATMLAAAESRME